MSKTSRGVRISSSVISSHWGTISKVPGSVSISSWRSSLPSILCSSRITSFLRFCSMRSTTEVVMPVDLSERVRYIRLESLPDLLNVLQWSSEESQYMGSTSYIKHRFLAEVRTGQTDAADWALTSLNEVQDTKLWPLGSAPTLERARFKL